MTTLPKLAGLQTLELPAGEVGGICEIDPVTGLMVCELPAAEPKTDQTTNDAPQASPARPTGDKK